MPPGSLAPTPPGAAEQAAPDTSGVATSAAVTPGVAASGVANRETPPGVAPAESGSRVASDAAATLPQGSVLLTPIYAVNSAARVTELQATRIGLYDEVQRIADERARLACEEPLATPAVQAMVMSCTTISRSTYTHGTVRYGHAVRGTISHASGSSNRCTISCTSGSVLRSTKSSRNT